MGIAVLGATLCEDACKYYVSEEGSDAADGSKAHPWRTVNHGWDQMGDGDSLAVKGEKFNLDPVLSTEEPLFFASLMAEDERMRLTCWGEQFITRDFPWLSGGTILETWEEIAIAGEGANDLTDGGFNEWTNSTTPKHWIPETSTHGKVEREDTSIHSGEHALRLKPEKEEPNTCLVKQTGIAYTPNLKRWLGVWHYAETGTGVASKKFSFELKITSGPDNGKFLQPDFTWAAKSARVSVPGAALAYFHDFITFTFPNSEGTYQLVVTRTDADTLFRIDDVEMKKPVAGSHIFRATTNASLPRPALMSWTPNDGEPELIPESTKPLAELGPKEWVWIESTHQIYINLGGLNPATDGEIEVAVTDILDSSGIGTRVSHLNFSHTWDRGIRARVTGFQLSNFEYRYSSSSGNAGTVVLGNNTDEEKGWSRVSKGKFYLCSNDGVWVQAKTKNFHLDFLIGEKFDVVTRQNGVDVTSDFIQIDANAGGNVGDSKANDLYGDHTHGLSAKGITIWHGVNDPVLPKKGTIRIDRIVGVGGNFGLSCGMPDLVAKDFIFFYQSPNQNWGGAVTTGEEEGHINGGEISDGIYVGNADQPGHAEGNGISLEDGTSYLTNRNFHDILIVNPGRSGVNLNISELTGNWENITIATPAGIHPTFAHLTMKHAVGAKLNNWQFPSEFEKCIRKNGTNYNTVAAAVAAGVGTNFSVHSLTEGEINAQIEEKLGRITRRVKGTAMTYDEMKEKAPAA